MAEKTSYTIEGFPSSRQSTFDAGYIGLRKHHIKALIELDVTTPRRLIKEYRNRTNRQLSFTAWILKCISQAVAENRRVHAVRKGNNQLVIFDDVDISLVVEREVKGQKVPLPVVIRKVNEKSLQEIQTEIIAAKEQAIGSEEDYVLGENAFKWAMKLYVSLPQFIRIFIWKMMQKNPFRLKKMSGTIIVTSVGMMGKVKGWVIPVSPLPVCFALGSIVKKPGVVEDRIEIRESLFMTILIDHDVIDGAPAARFVSRLSELIENGHGLSETQ